MGYRAAGQARLTFPASPAESRAAQRQSSVRSTSMGKSLEEQIAETMKLLGDPQRCGWAGCTKQFNGTNPPPGWATLTVASPTKRREVTLCPAHRGELEGKLEDVE